MPFFKYMLFLADFLDRCRAAEPFVISTARQFQAKITALNMANIPSAWYGNGEAPCPVMLDIPTLLQVGEKQITSYLEAREPAQVDRVALHGDPATQIATFAQQPTHGYGQFHGLLLGSVTAKVLYDVDCAVWTVTHTEDPGTAKHVDCRSILCAVDLVPENANLIRYAADVASACKAQLRLVHTSQLPLLSWTDPRYIELRQNILAWSRERVCELQRDAGTNLELYCDVGSVTDVLRSAASCYNAALLVIGRGRSQRSSSSFRADSYAIICESPFPVLRV